MSFRESKRGNFKKLMAAPERRAAAMSAVLQWMLKLTGNTSQTVAAPSGNAEHSIPDASIGGEAAR